MEPWCIFGWVVLSGFRFGASEVWGLELQDSRV